MRHDVGDAYRLRQVQARKGIWLNKEADRDTTCTRHRKENCGEFDRLLFRDTPTHEPKVGQDKSRRIPTVGIRCGICLLVPKREVSCLGPPAKQLFIEVGRTREPVKPLWPVDS